MREEAAVAVVALGRLLRSHWGTRAEADKPVLVSHGGLKGLEGRDQQALSQAVNLATTGNEDGQISGRIRFCPGDDDRDHAGGDEHVPGQALA